MKRRRLLSAIALPSLLAAALMPACSSDASDGTCPETSAVCEGVCVDARVDPQNCGACGNACASGEVCSAGSCEDRCGDGATACSGSCVDTNLDPKHCGGCDTACADGEVCSDGECGLGCQGGTALCGDRCSDLNVDEANCGACGVACAAGEICQAGSCQKACGDGTTLCGNACVDTQTDEAHCGSCDQACGTLQVCTAGMCEDDEAVGVLMTSAAGTFSEPYGLDLHRYFKASGELVQVNTQSLSSETVVDYATTKNGDIVFVAAQVEGGPRELYLAPADGTAPVKLSSTLTQGGNVEAGIALSKDGTKAMYRADQDTDERSELYVVDLSKPGTTTKVNGPLIASQEVLAGHSFSGDGSKAVYLASDGAEGYTDAFVVDLSSPGNATMVADASTFQGSGGVWDAKLDNTGDKVVYRGPRDTSGREELYAASVASPASPTKLSVQGAEGSPYGDVGNYKISNDGSRVLYTANVPSDNFSYRLYSVPLNGKATSTVLSGEMAYSVAPDFWLSDDDATVVFRADGGEGYALWTASAATADTATALFAADGGEGGSVNDFAVSADGKMVATRLGNWGDGAEGQLGRGLALNGNPFGEGSQLLSFPLAQPEQHVTLATGVGQAGVYSGYAISKDGAAVLYRADTAGDDTQRAFAVSTAAPDDSRDISPALSNRLYSSYVIEMNAAGDTALLAADFDAENRLELYAAPVAVGGVPTRLNAPLSSGQDLYDATYNATGTAVLYSVSGGALGSELHLVPDLTMPGKTVPLATGGARGLQELKFSPDGKWVAAEGYNQDSSGLLVVELANPQVVKFAHPAPSAGMYLDSFEFTADSSAIVYSGEMRSDGDDELFITNLSSLGTATVLNHNIGTGDVANNWALSSDGKFVVYTAYDSNTNRRGLHRVQLANPTVATDLLGSVPGSGYDVSSGSRNIKLTSDDKRVVFYGDLTTAGVTELYYVDLASPGTHVALSGSLPVYADVSDVVLSPDNNAVAFLADSRLNSSYEAHYATFAAAGSYTVLNTKTTSSSYDVYSGSMRFAGDSKTVVYRGDVFQSGHVQLLSTAVANPGVSVVLDNTTSYDDVDFFAMSAGGKIVFGEWDTGSTLYGVSLSQPGIFYSLGKKNAAADVARLSLFE